MKKPMLKDERKNAAELARDAMDEKSVPGWRAYLRPEQVSRVYFDSVIHALAGKTYADRNDVIFKNDELSMVAEPNFFVVRRAGKPALFIPYSNVLSFEY